GKRAVSPIYTFGAPDPEEAGSVQNDSEPYLQNDMDFMIRLNMRHVLVDFKEKGYFETYDGEKVMSDDFRGVYVAGGTEPLSWEFESLPQKPHFKLRDPDGDGIYEVTVRFKQFQMLEYNADDSRWELQHDVSQYPRYKSDIVLSDALYNMSLEELQLDIRPDGAFMAGAKWPGVWTRDISYSILLSLAMLNPDASKKSLMAKVKKERIIQDTGTGGSWPVSTDRMTWALAAWEVYLVTGDGDWLKTAYHIIKNSAEDDLNTAYNHETGLMYGESSFLDWREQTYPRWMDPKDIYRSQNLGTNAVHYQTYRILEKMAAILGEPETVFAETAKSIRDGINKYLWIDEKGFYGQYLYGRNYLSLSPRSETLGEALTVLFDIADENQQHSIFENTPVIAFGAPCIFPQIPNIPPYHNDGIWPFVVSYWTWAAALAQNTNAVEHGLASIYRAAALFLTNKENFVASTADFMGTEINSDRQLWSVAGNLAMVYRVLFGMKFTPEGLLFQPFIPKSLAGTSSLNHFEYRNAKLDIKISGYGNQIKSFRFDGEKMEQAFIPNNVNGNHSIEIEMANNEIKSPAINLRENTFAPETPVVKSSAGTLNWEPVDGASTYFIYKNGKHIQTTSANHYEIPETDEYSEYQVLAVDSRGWKSFLSEPVVITGAAEVITIQAEKFGARSDTRYQGYSGSGYIPLDKEVNNEIQFPVKIEAPGLYAIDVHYANGNGPINTNNKCAIRTLSMHGERVGAVIMAQRGIEQWDDWGFSNSLKINLPEGEHQLSLSFTESDNNMNVEVNFALLDYVRLIRVPDMSREK
ncbi:Bacterial alpha-L-rhamnosidase, partial [candidate division KSB1 bacterium]|nr:Bacterial alpha-L-rhamnosidase [candidate division KSB1 bacterium]